MKYGIIILSFICFSSVGQSVQNFTLKDVVSGKDISLNDYSSLKGVILIFTSNNCPYDGYYLDRIKAFSEAYQSITPVLLINSHIDGAESVNAMANYATMKGLTMPYLADKDQVVMTAFNARKSPECVLLQSVDGKFSIVYRGAIDSNPQLSTDVDHNYLRDAIEKMLAGQKPAANEVRPVGCSIGKN